jgi:hypothetical protein
VQAEDGERRHSNNGIWTRNKDREVWSCESRATLGAEPNQETGSCPPWAQCHPTLAVVKYPRGSNPRGVRKVLVCRLHARIPPSKKTDQKSVDFLVQNLIFEFGRKKSKIEWVLDLSAGFCLFFIQNLNENGKLTGFFSLSLFLCFRFFKLIFLKL